VHVIEEDDGSGWVKVLDEDGGRGLVPASYIESADVTQAPSPGTGPFLGSGQFGESYYLSWFPRGPYCWKFVDYMITAPRVQTSWTFRRVPELN
jgi:hypothetical protein